MGESGVIDTAQIIYDYLTEIGTDLYEQCATRVWTPVAPNDWANAVPCIIFNEQSSGAHYSGATVRSLFNFKCYGGSSQYGNEASVFRYLFDRLHGATATVASGGIISSQLVSANQMAPEPDTQFHSYQCSFAITFANV